MSNSGAAVAEASLASAPRMHAPFAVLVRLTIISIAMLLLAQIFGVNLIERLLPAFRAEIYKLDDNITIFGMGVVQEDMSNRLRMRANLWKPVYINHSAIYPLGSNGRPQGWYQVHLTAGGVLQSSLLLLIVVLSWPHRSIGELVMRLGFALPLIAVLLAIDTPLELLGNFRHVVLLDIDPQPLQPMFIWDKFLEGGGNCVLALAFAALAIVLAARFTERVTAGIEGTAHALESGGESGSRA